jgi:hypothetical protein
MGEVRLELVPRRDDAGGEIVLRGDVSGGRVWGV